jgi:hypothetical protein
MDIGLGIALAALPLGGVAGYCWLRARGPRNTETCHARCPRCEQKIRYLANRAGRVAACPRCRHRWPLPTTPQTMSMPEARQSISVRRK